MGKDAIGIKPDPIYVRISNEKYLFHGTKKIA
jgi:hypothetical protein